MPSKSTHPLPEMQEWLDKWYPEGHEVTEVTAEMNAENPLAVNIPPGQPGAYEPKFVRESVTHRILAHITDENDLLGGVYAPRNTPDMVGKAVIPDKDTAVSTQEQVETEFAKLKEAGLIEQRDDGSYGKTRDGWVELVN